MKSSPLRSTAFALLLLTLPLGLSGCGKIKSLLSRKPKEPTPAEAGGTAPATDPATGKPTAVSNASPGPALRPLPTIDTSGSVAVLCYHRFEAGHGQLIISPQEFEAQMKRIKDAGLSVISMSDLLAWRRGEKSIPPRSVVITLDDGWISGYSEAWPILKRLGFPFTMFIYTDYVRGGPKSGGKSISWEQLAEMRDNGIDVECHTVTHSDLRAARHKMPDDQYRAFLQTELATSKDTLEQKLAIGVKAIAYPYGNYTDVVEQMVRQIGYEAAFTVNPQKVTYNSPADKLGRYAIDGLTPKVFDAAINFGASSNGPVTQEVAPLAASSMLTKPGEGETVHTDKPLIEANLQTLGKIDPGSVVMRLSGFGQVQAKYDPASGLIKYQPPTRLTPKMYTVIVEAMADGRRVATNWHFSVDQAAAAAAATDPKPAPPTGKPAGRN